MLTDNRLPVQGQDFHNWSFIAETHVDFHEELSLRTKYLGWYKKFDLNKTSSKHENFIRYKAIIIDRY